MDDIKIIGETARFRTEVPVKIVGFSESRDLRHLRDAGSDKILSMEPVKGSERAFLTLELPNGKALKAEIAYTDFESCVVPLLKEIAGISGDPIKAG